VPITNVIIEIHAVLLFTLHNTKIIAYHITEVLIYYADKLMVMGNSKNSCVFNFAILLKSRKFDACEIYVFYTKMFRNFRHVRSLQLFKKQLVQWTSNTSVTCDTFIICLAISVLFMCLYSCMSYYYLLRLSSFYFPDHCKCYLFSLMTPVHSVRV